MFVVHTTVPIDPAHRAEAMHLVRELVDRSRTEDGTVRYRAMEDVVDSNIVRFFEQYEDAGAAEDHTTSSQYRRFVEALPDIASGPLETIQYETDELEVFEYDASDVIE